MVIIKTLEEFEKIPKFNLVYYLVKRYINLMQEYDCSMCEIGEVNIYQSDSEFLVNGLNQATYELMEVIQLNNVDYLHLVLIVDDYYAKDIYVPIKSQVI